jgi:hypothetical protein
MIGTIGIGTFLIFTLGLISLLVCCIGCTTSTPLRYAVVATSFYGGFLLVIHFCSRKDTNVGLISVANDDVDYIWLARVLVGLFLSFFSGVSVLVLIQYHFSAELRGKELDRVHM